MCSIFPHSSATVEISVIDTTTYLANVDPSTVVDPVYPGMKRYSIPSYSFLIHHRPTKSRLLFDLGLRKNWRTHLSPHIFTQVIEPLKIEVSCEKDVADILMEQGRSPNDINTIIFSHHHWDHVGDTTRFPGSTNLLVGPGYKKKYLPGWPVDPEAVDTTSDLYEGRETIELGFSPEDPKTLQIGEFQAQDWFGDGSFYILNTPGHTTGHLCALARTTAETGDSAGESTFIFLGGDIAHHCALFRPTEYCPLPDKLSPAPYDKPYTTGAFCSSELFSSIHRAQNSPDGQLKAHTTPFCCVPEGNPVDEDPAAAQDMLMKMLRFDGDDNVLTIFAHDETLLDVIDFFPQLANDWKEKQWGRQGHWRFLAPINVKRPSP
jgi:glyoxylase-like metal-dependent hydrolase (beta-lactamase superfamily II)